MKESKESKSLPKPTVKRKSRLSCLTARGKNCSGVNDLPNKPTHSYQRKSSMQGFLFYVPCHQSVVTHDLDGPSSSKGISLITMDGWIETEAISKKWREAKNSNKKVAPKFRNSNKNLQP
jgi:hypothetical protein